MRPLFMSIALFLGAFAITGCTTTTLPKTNDRLTRQALEADYYQVRIPTRDGQKLAATVYQPELQSGRALPW